MSPGRTSGRDGAPPPRPGWVAAPWGWACFRVVGRQLARRPPATTTSPSSAASPPSPPSLAEPVGELQGEVGERGAQGTARVHADLLEDLAQVVIDGVGAD